MSLSGPTPSPTPWEKLAEVEVLDHRVFLEDFSLVHLDETRVDLGPRRDRRGNVVKYRRVLVEGPPFQGVDMFYRREEEVVVRVRLDGGRRKNIGRLQVALTWDMMWMRSEGPAGSAGKGAIRLGSSKLPVLN